MLSDFSRKTSTRSAPADLPRDNNSSICGFKFSSKIWNSKSGKATPLDRILIIAPSNSNPTVYRKNKNILWNKTED